MRSRVYQADWLDQRDAGIDLRITRRSDLASTIVTRALHLRGQDRSLVLAMYSDGKSAAEIARLGNLEPRQVRRRIKNALIRMQSPVFIFVLNHQSNWSSTRRKVASSLFREGHSIRQTAEDLGLKVHQVRRHRSAILDLMDAHGGEHQHATNRAWRNTDHAAQQHRNSSSTSRG